MKLIECENRIKRLIEESIVLREKMILSVKSSEFLIRQATAIKRKMSESTEDNISDKLQSEVLSLIGRINFEVNLISKVNECVRDIEIETESLRHLVINNLLEVD